MGVKTIVLRATADWMGDAPMGRLYFVAPHSNNKNNKGQHKTTYNNKETCNYHIIDHELVRTAPLPLTKGRGWGWGCMSLIISDITLRCNTPPLAPPLKWEGNCMARHSWLFFPYRRTIALGLDKFLTLENANNICILLA